MTRTLAVRLDSDGRAYRRREVSGPGVADDDGDRRREHRRQLGERGLPGDRDGPRHQAEGS